MSANRPLIDAVIAKAVKIIEDSIFAKVLNRA